MSELAICGGQPVRTAPFRSWPVFDQAEEEALLSVLRSGEWWKYSFGAATQPGHDAAPSSCVEEFQSAFAKAHGARYGIACVNGTAALEIALRAIGIQPGDEVVVPPYTFVATATAPLLVNAVPVFCDIHPDTFNLDPACLKKAITPRTKAIIPVHFAGLAADMAAILELARQHHLHVIEDAAHAHGGSWQGQPLGSLGDLGTFSFQASKNMTAGEGGIIITNDKALAELCESYVWGGREPGHAWYEHFRLGWNYRLTEFQAAILLQQLRRLPEQTATRNRNADYLCRKLEDVPGIHPLHSPPYATRHAQHIFLLRFREDEFGLSRSAFLAALEREGVPCQAGYAFPIYKNPMFLHQDFGGLRTNFDYRSFEALCPASEQACREAIWLEHRLLLGSTRDMDDIAHAFWKIYRFQSELAQSPERVSIQG